MTSLILEAGDATLANPDDNGGLADGQGDLRRTASVRSGLGTIDRERLELLLAAGPAEVALLHGVELRVQFVADARGLFLGRRALGERLFEVLPELAEPELRGALGRTLLEACDEGGTSQVVIGGGAVKRRTFDLSWRRIDRSGSGQAEIALHAVERDGAGAPAAPAERVEASLRQKVRAREVSLAVAAHELRTPLTTLQLQTEALLRSCRRGPIDTQRLCEKLATLQRQASRLSLLTDGLLDVSRIARGDLRLERSMIDLGSLVQEVAERYSPDGAAAGCTLSVTIEDQHIVGLWDPVRIDQVVGNLLSNAIRYGSGRPISLRVSRQASDAIVEVADRGEGIAPEDQRRILELFERGDSERHHAGLGLGLWITRQIVESHGGRLGLESARGLGTTVRVALPLSPH